MVDAVTAPGARWSMQRLPPEPDGRCSDCPRSPMVDVTSCLCGFCCLMYKSALNLNGNSLIQNKCDDSPPFLPNLSTTTMGNLSLHLTEAFPTIASDEGSTKSNSSFLDGYRHVPTKVLPFPSQLVYNRVGKCGSRTVVQLLRVLTERNHFNLINSDIHNKTRLNRNEQMELINNISLGEKPYLYTRHVHFLNFTRFGLEQPVYINIIRDPISRFVSNYFFRRFGDWRSEQNHQIRTPGMKDEERYLDINDCILENYPECNNPRVFYIIPYFCGQHPKCRDPGDWALQRAKKNMNENYLLVGILEELEDVLLLLERLLPHYFKDASAVYHSAEYRKLGNGTITVKKQVPSPEALKVLYQRMRYEYDFYNYVKDQFHLLKRKFGLKIQGSTPNRKSEILSRMAIAGPGHQDDDDAWLKDIYR